MQLHLIDLNADVVTAWQRSFAPHPEVRISVGDILVMARQCVVSPANSLGFMDGGIDACYTELFGLQPQRELQDHISRTGELPVGSALLVNTGHARIPYMICTPTMARPGPVPSHNAFYAMAAMLNAVTRNCAVLHEVFCPGLCTGVGAVDPEYAAAEMAHAYRKWHERSEAC